MQRKGKDLSGEKESENIGNKVQTTRKLAQVHTCMGFGGSLQRASLTPVKVHIRGGGNKLGIVSIRWALRARLNQQTSYTRPLPPNHMSRLWLRKGRFHPCSL